MSAAHAAELPVAALICEQRDELPWVDVAEAALASDTRLRLVDREHLATVLAEQKLAMLMGPADGAARIQVGRLVGCDLLIIVRYDPGPQEVVRVVIADARTGIRLVNADYPSRRLTETRQLPPALLDDALVKRAIARPIVLAIPPFANDDLSRSNQFLQDSLATVCVTVAARYPEILLVELEEAREIAKENDLTARATSRVLPHFLLGRFRLESANEERPPLAVLRLERGNSLLAERRLESPTPETVAAFVQSAAAALLSSLADDRGEAKVDDAADAEKLARQSFEFIKVGDYEQGVRLAEASLLLRPDRLDLRHALRNAYKDLAQLQYDDPRMDQRRFERQFEKAMFYAERNLHHLRVYLEAVDQPYSGNPAPVNVWAFDRDSRSNAAVHAAIVQHHRDYREMLVETIERKIKRGQQTGDMSRLLLPALGYYHKQDDGSLKQYLTDRLRLLRIVGGTPQQRRYFYSTILTFGITSPDADAFAFYESLFEASDPELVAAAKTAKEEGERRMGIRPVVAASSRSSPPKPTAEPAADADSPISVRLTPLQYTYLQDGRRTGIQFQGLLSDERGHEVVWGDHGRRVVLHHRGEEPFRKIFEADEQHDFGHGCHDGKFVWLPVSGGAAHILRIDPVDGTIVKVGAEHGLPDVQGKFVTAVTAPLEPGRIVLVASFGLHKTHRTFVAEIACIGQESPRVRVVHEAREEFRGVGRQASEEQGRANTNLNYSPKFVLPLNDAGSASPTRVLIARLVSGNPYQTNSLIVDLATGKVEVSPAAAHSHLSPDDFVIRDGAAYWVTYDKIWKISADDTTRRQAVADVKVQDGTLYFTSDGILVIGVDCWYSETGSKPFQRVPSGSEKFFKSYYNSSYFSAQFGPLLKASLGGRKVYRVEVVARPMQK